MPLYEYRCPTCGDIFEKIVRMGSAESPRCPSCGASNAKRLLSAPARVGGGSSGDTGSDCGPSGGT